MIKPITIDKKIIGPGKSPYVIAEIGVNHNGRLDLALRLIDAAAKAGADAVKFQTFRAEQVTTAQTPLASYQAKNLGTQGSMIAMIKKLEFKEQFYPRVIKHCKARSVTFLSAPHGGFESVALLQKLNVPAFKIASGDLTNLPLLDYAARTKKPMIISTGMATMAEVEEAVATIKKTGNNKIIVLHCTTDYPTAPDEVNLAVIPAMIKKLKTPVGYSDHTIGIQVPIMAVTLGACLIEKHFTLDRKLPGPDHKASATPLEFRRLVTAVKNVTTILGTAEKKPTAKELQFKPIVRKSVVARRDIARGDTFSAENLAIKRPGTGLTPKYFNKIIGRKAKGNITKDTLLKPSDYL